MSLGGRVRRRDTRAIVDNPDKGSADCAGLDEGLAAGTGGTTARGLPRDSQTNYLRRNDPMENERGGTEERKTNESKQGREGEDRPAQVTSQVGNT